MPTGRDRPNQRDNSEKIKASVTASQWYQAQQLAQQAIELQMTNAECVKKIMEKAKEREKVFEVKDDIIKCKAYNGDLERKIEEARYRVNKLQRGLVNKDKNIQLKRLESEDITREKEEIEDKINVMSETIKVLGKRAKVTQLQLKLRQRYMIKELMAIFDIKINLDPMDFAKRSANGHPKFSSSPCRCQKMDTILGLHLPNLTSLLNHPEQVVISAMDQLVHLLISVGHVLDYSFRHQMHYNGMHSHVSRMSPESDVKDEVFKFHEAYSKDNRDKFITGYSLVNRNIAQLRYDNGLHTNNEDRTLLNILEVLTFIGSGLEREKAESKKQLSECEKKILRPNGNITP
uniref:PUB domain-containing protein n=1 Tax=Rhabditophanes sp. KR3021 TaxID=114890 RepID=A0AC35U2Q8_9BILA